MKWLLVIMLVGADKPLTIPFENEAVCEAARAKLVKITRCQGLDCKDPYLLSRCIQVRE